MMINDRSQNLAVQQYTKIIYRNKLSDADGYIYIAVHPELDGCMAQGDTVEEAKALLDEVRADYMEHLQEHKLPIPAPKLASNLLILSHTISESSEQTEDNSEETFFAIP